MIPEDAATPEGPRTEALTGEPLPLGMPERIGQYRILRLLGKGGMGSVFEAEQSRPKRRVALKLMRTDATIAESAARFEQESTALARLHHPGIAQVYETGTIAIAGAIAQPWFAMELVEGVPLTRYATERELGTRERLALVIRICDAVQHAHQHGIIHRDLKPANILVDASGQPKILDFGLARLTDSDVRVTTVATGVGLILGTLPYMSPEQAAGDPAGIDTRSDVYSLGVLCYELLVGRLPHDVARKLVHEAVRAIREDEPTKLSSFDRTLRGDVETIVAKALEKDRGRRYQTAGELGSDLQRFLNDEPIVARPASAWYQVVKFAHRNRILVGGIAATFLALVAGLVVSTILLFQAKEARARAEAKRREAETQAARASATIEFLQEMLTASNPHEGGQRDISLREVTDRAARNAAGSFEGQPQVEGTVLGLLAATYGAIDAAPESERLFERALALLEPLGAPADAARADLLNSRGVARIHAERYVEAFADFEAALALLPADDPDYRAKRYRFRENWGNAARFLGRDQEVTAMLREVLAGRIELFGEESLEVAKTRHNLGTHLRTLGNVTESRTLGELALATFLREFGPDHVLSIEAMSSKVEILKAVGAFEEAEQLALARLAATRVVFGADSGAAADVLQHVALLHANLGRYAEAERELREALATLERADGERSVAAAGARRELASVLLSLKRAAEAEPLARAALQMLRELAGPESDLYSDAVSTMAFVARDLGKLDEAEQRFRETLELERRRHSPKHPDALVTLENLANFLMSRGNLSAAEPMLNEVLSGRIETLGEDHPAVARTRFNLACAKRDRGDLAGAKAQFAQAVEQFRRQLPPSHPDALYGMAQLIALDLDPRVGDLDEAELLQRELLERTVAARGEKHADSAREARRLAAILVSRGEVDEAAELLERAWEVAIVLEPRNALLIREIRQALVDLYTAEDDLEKAGEWRTRAVPPAPGS